MPSEANGGGIWERYKEDVLNALDIEHVAGLLVQGIAPASGNNMKGECPFPHGDGKPDRHKHFGISRDPNYPWRCMKCGKSGDLIALVQEVMKLDFREAVQWLADIAGIPRPSVGGKTAPTVPEKDVQEFLLRQSERWHEALFQNAEALAYLRDARGITTETIRRFQLGYCDRIPAIQNRDRAEASGLFYPSSRDARKLVPVWEDCITIPVFRGDRVVTMTSRRLHPAAYQDGAPKPSHVHLRRSVKPWWNQEAARNDWGVFVVEAPLDGMSYEQQDLPSCALLGAHSFKETDHSKFGPDNAIFLSLDDDPAGVAATWRIAEFLFSKGKYNVHCITFESPDGSKVDPNRYFLARGPADFRRGDGVFMETFVDWALGRTRIEERRLAVAFRDRLDLVRAVRPIVKAIAGAPPMALAVMCEQIAEAALLPYEAVREEAALLAPPEGVKPRVRVS